MFSSHARRAEKIRANQALLDQLDIKPVATKNASRAHDRDARSTSKRRRNERESIPSRKSARIAAASTEPIYRAEPDVKVIALRPPSSLKEERRGKGSAAESQSAALVPVQDVESIRAGWTAWVSTSLTPARDQRGTFHFEDYPDFTPNKSPEEILKEGCFGGSYYRPLRSKKLGIVIEEDWKELPVDWIAGLKVEKYLTSASYDPDVNKFKVSCGQSIEEWEAAGWIRHEYDVRGWFQWYTRFFRGRRCEDDARQVSRWKKCVGDTGRWRRLLLKKYVQMGVREVFDDGDEEGGREVSPVIHQTCHHWAFEVRQGDLDAFWAENG
ncbi:hypothetical protein M433DRAFT_144196 [Acidomyces richmondensis BFW]|nr:hypothetical protein M433DRAFT_144196 [Acidomyces richmondensis BFW]